MNIFNRIKSKVSQISRVSRLAPGLKEKFNLIFWSLWLALRHRLGLTWGGAHKLEFRYKGTNFRFYSYYSTDIAMFDEIFIDKVYEFDDNISPKIIFDIGSNTGVSVKFLRLKFPESLIFAFEPDPQVFKALELNAKDATGVKTFNIAVTAKDGPIEFYIHPKSPIVSSLYPRFSEQKKIAVEGKSLSTILKDLSIDEIDLLKIDVEGAEGEIFSSFDTRKIKTMVGELHTDLAKMSLHEFKQLFPAHEFTVIKQMSPIRYSLLARKREVKG